MESCLDGFAASTAARSSGGAGFQRRGEDGVNKRAREGRTFASAQTHDLNTAGWGLATAEKAVPPRRADGSQGRGAYESEQRIVTVAYSYCQ
jgi:hypothetical protein